jgi:FAD/FMN-containing dehydrogenase
MSKIKIQNWGCYPKIEADVFEPKNFLENSEYIINASKLIPRGNGRCYGDSSLQSSVISTLKMNKFIDFDKLNGIIKVESGILLSKILEIIVPCGFFLPVTPGTKWITIGGAIASNVHGKNHHKEGAISNFIVSFELMNEEGIILNCSRNENQSIFINTIGGMGLTGLITSVTLKLKKIETSYINQKTLKAKNLNQVLDYFEKYNDYTYSVAWIDCLKKGKNMGRSLLMLGEHTTKNELLNKIHKPLTLHKSKQINVPFYLPSFFLNPLTISCFNEIFYHKNFSKEKDDIIHYDPFFYPLDKIDNWNRIYGKNGFTQYQFLIPFENGRKGLNEILELITQSGTGSFLAVLKTLSKKDPFSSSLSFPDEGYTLTLDFKISNKVFALLDKLDDIVLKYGGKLYLSKDVRMSKNMFKNNYPEQFQFSTKFISHQIERLCD